MQNTISTIYSLHLPLVWADWKMVRYSTQIFQPNLPLELHVYFFHKFNSPTNTIFFFYFLLSDWLESLSKLPINTHQVEYQPRVINTKEKNFPCPNCPTGFSEKSSLTRHLRYECGQEPRFKCPYCSYRTKWTSSIYNHVRNKHEGQKVYCVDVFAAEACMAGRRGSIDPTK